MHRIQVHKPDEDEDKPRSHMAYVVVACIIAASLSVVLITQVLSISRRNKKIRKSKVWIPQMATLHGWRFLILKSHIN